MLAARAPFALLPHRRLEAREVEVHASLTADIGSQVHGETEGVVELEHGLAVEQFFARSERALQHAHAVLERLGEALLFLLEHVGDAPRGAAQLRVSIAHRLVQVRHQPVEERFFLTELVAVANGPADDPAQHVAAAFVARDHAVHDQEAAGADVVRDDVERRILQDLLPGLARRGLDQVLEQVDLVVRMHVLQHRGDALQAHARVDGGLRAAASARHRRPGRTA